MEIMIARENDYFTLSSSVIIKLMANSTSFMSIVQV